MPRTDLPLTDLSRAGVAPGAEVNGDVTNNHEFSNNGRVFLLVRNSDASVARTVTIVTPGTVDGQAVADIAISVPATVSRYIGPFPEGIYNVAGGVVQVNVDHANLRLTAYRLPA